MRLFLLTMALLGASTTFAQEVSNVNLNKVVKTTPLFKAEKATKTSFSPRKSPDNGLFYGRPTGAFYRGNAEAGGSYYFDMMFLSPERDVTFKNKSVNPSGTEWYINNKPAPNEYVSDNNFILPVNCAGTYYSPELREGAKKYQFGEESSAWGTPQGGSFVTVADTLNSFSFVDPAMGSYAWNGTSFADGHYWFGTNNTFKDEEANITYYNSGVYQVFDTPMSPLYIKNIFCPIVSDGTPFTGDVKLLLTVRNVVTRENGSLAPGDEIIAQMTAGESDLANVSKQTPAGSTKEFTFGTLVFAKKVFDELGTQYDEPIILDKAFAVVITGFQDDGVNIGINGTQIPKADTDRKGIDGVQPSQHLLLDKATGESAKFTVSYSSFGAAINLLAIYDHVSVSSSLADNSGQNYEQANVFRISNDGQTMTPENPELVGKIDAAFVRTAMPWADGDGISNYEVENMPDWVTEISGQDDTQTQGGHTYRTGTAFVQFKCEALPSGVEGRQATIYLTGKGVKSSTPVVLLQGNAVNAIDNISSSDDNVMNNEMFNVAGQRVDNNYKGIVIKNGKKFINK